jgi:hypothetical protein
LGPRCGQQSSSPFGILSDVVGRLVATPASL